MTITKYEHACFVVEHKGKKIIIDPGVFSTSLGKADNVAAIILTHQHADHVDQEKVKALLAANPGASLYGTRDTAAAYLDLPVTIMHSGEVLNRDNFEIEFYGGQHAETHSSILPVENIGLLINHQIYYPGDALVKPDVVQLDVLLAPTAAPWLKIGEVIDYISTVRASHVIPTHDAILSKEGKGVYDKHLAKATETAGGSYRRLKPGESFKL